jgi:membrane protease YdiL (CAAX protease family)
MSAPINQQNFFKTACLFEGSLVVIAMIIGWLTDINPFASIHYSEAAVFNGIVATIPLFLIFMALYQTPLASLQQIRKTLLDTLGPLMARYSKSDLFILAAIAGITEEILFRGTLQPWLEHHWGMTAGLIGSNIIFGLVHAVTPMYALLAASVGIYLGLLLDYGDQRNLLTPIVVHGFYDFLAFLVIMRTYRAEQTKINKP